MRRIAIWLSLTLVLTGMAFYYQFNFTASHENQGGHGADPGGASALEAERSPEPGEEK
ncbi:MAG TPA: hypothetical protein VEW07_08960 [Solirubrobacterales bacterium]|nr:hypothetical protein [Solirubrobacterales bacterium]